MNIRTMALIGGTIAVAFTSVMVACSSSSSGGGGSSSSGSSSGTTSSSGSSSGTTSSGGSSSGTLEDGGGADACTKKPPETHASTAEGGIYCPFSFDDATDSGSQYCANGTQQCCLSSGSDAGPSACVAFATSATPGGFTQSAGCGAATDSIWQCGAPTDCVQAGPVLPLADGGPGVASDAGPIVCCLLGGNLEANYDSCSNIQSTHFGGTSCQPASVCQGSIPVASGTKVYQDPLYTVCVTTADCPSPTSQTCTPIYTTGTPIGVCLPQ